MLSTLLSLFSAALSGFFVNKYGLLESALLGFNNLGLSIRLDALSITMFSMIAIIGFVVVKYSLNYLDGDGRQGRFIGRLAATIASVQLLVLAGNLGLLLISWMLTSISLHRLLVFYKERPGAIIAARKKFIVARLGDASLLTAVFLLFSQFGTGNLEVIFQEIKFMLTSGSIPVILESAALFLVLAAILKSAQFPTHGWLIEVMETPTPVSALLHAGLLNAGPFLLIRMAYVMEASTYAPILIILIGAFTALFASLAFLTQTSVKTALGYSSVAHMGFSLMVCGMGVYPAAMLHLVAHSYYKAHSFLSSGSIIDVIRASKVQKAKRTGNPIKIIVGIMLAIIVYTGFAMLWGLDPVDEFALLAIGAIIVMGLSTLFTSALDSNGSIHLILRAVILAIVVTASFFILESVAHYLLASQLPELIKLTLTELVIVGVVLIAFGTAIFIQIIAPLLPTNHMYTAFGIHLRNGFYANALFDRAIGALRIQSPVSQSIPIGEAETTHSKTIKIEKLQNQTA
jgi:NAD(P)H-quinone oxidoreductase subunit 5